MFDQLIAFLKNYELVISFRKKSNVSPPAKPGKVGIFHKEQLSMSRFAIEFSLPAPGASDVASRELTIAMEGVDTPTVKTYPPDATKTEKIEFDENSNLTLTLVDIDADNNRSQPSDPFVYKVIDDVAPPAPGAVGVSSKTQI